MFKRILAITLLLSSNQLVAQTAVYKCVIDGVVSYSQLPCSQDAQKLDVKTLVDKQQVMTSTPADSGIANYIDNRAISRELAQSKDKIDTYSLQMRQELTELEAQANGQRKNLAGAEREKAIATQMQSSIDHYQALINREQLNIDRLLLKQQMTAEPSNKDDSVDEYIKMQRIEREIREHEDKIETYHQQLDSELKALKIKTTGQSANLVAAKFDNANAQRMSAITAKYATLIDIEQKALQRLTNEYALLKAK
ncbi:MULTISPECIES: DUF4124 domain-containing protein [unclassified Pseudoalteromonas]|uniref:DUF4124 domain-containing protein n=1 Tax=unclassified Pseudoalteromonas TaxID=194690 RepID=UPI000CF697A5|nr:MULTISPECIES: DUF4124 domain-containing protein [unclassified Pseudoalteromonas]